MVLLDLYDNGQCQARVLELEERRSSVKVEGSNVGLLEERSVKREHCSDMDVRNDRKRQRTQRTSEVVDLTDD